uniref:JmjC domain-containing protein n=1 Tax=Steinernema glaseri TaxID=37863 RepID=A0A1I7ZIR8_9BILA
MRCEGIIKLRPLPTGGAVCFTEKTMHASFNASAVKTPDSVSTAKAPDSVSIQASLSRACQETHMEHSGMVFSRVFCKQPTLAAWHCDLSDP